MILCRFVLFYHILQGGTYSTSTSSHVKKKKGFVYPFSEKVSAVKLFMNDMFTSPAVTINWVHRFRISDLVKMKFTQTQTTYTAPFSSVI